MNEPIDYKYIADNWKERWRERSGELDNSIACTDYWRKKSMAQEKELALYKRDVVDLQERVEIWRKTAWDREDEMEDVKRVAAIDRKDAIEAVANADKWQDKFETAMDQLKDAGIEFDAELSPDNA